MFEMLTERTQMSQNILGWCWKIFSVTLSEEAEQSQLAHDTLQSL